jgi:CheY-like chemotaxis protein
MRLLLADDNEMNVDLAVAALDGHDIVVERDGPGALKTALQQHFDLVLLDVQMPGMSGLEVCRNLRNAGVRTPIIALTADAMPADVARGHEAGFDEYLTKPIAPAALSAAVERYRRAA